MTAFFLCRDNNKKLVITKKRKFMASKGLYKYCIV